MIWPTFIARWVQQLRYRHLQWSCPARAPPPGGEGSGREGRWWGAFGVSIIRAVVGPVCQRPVVARRFPSQVPLNRILAIPNTRFSEPSGETEWKVLNPVVWNDRSVSGVLRVIRSALSFLSSFFYPRGLARRWVKVNRFGVTGTPTPAHSHHVAGEFHSNIAEW